jgi:hypothetical protein
LGEAWRDANPEREPKPAPIERARDKRVGRGIGRESSFERAPRDAARGEPVRPDLFAASIPSTSTAALCCRPTGRLRIEARSQSVKLNRATSGPQRW